MWKAIAHLLSSDLLSGTLCNAELLITPLNALGFGGVNDSAIVDYEMVKTALTIRGQKEYSRAYRDLNIEGGGSNILVARVGIQKERGGKRVTEVGCFSSVAQGLEAEVVERTNSTRGMTLPEDIQNDLIEFLVDKPWNKQFAKPKKRQPMPASNTTTATNALAADGARRQHTVTTARQRGSTTTQSTSRSLNGE